MGVVGTNGTCSAARPRKNGPTFDHDEVINAEHLANACPTTGKTSRRYCESRSRTATECCAVITFIVRYEFIELSYHFRRHAAPRLVLSDEIRRSHRRAPTYLGGTKFLHLLSRHRRRCSLRFLWGTTSSHSSLGHATFLYGHSFVACSRTSEYECLLNLHLSSLGHERFIASRACESERPLDLTSPAFVLHAGHVSLVSSHFVMHAAQKFVPHAQSRCRGSRMMSAHATHVTSERGTFTDSSAGASRFRRFPPDPDAGVVVDADISDRRRIERERENTGTVSVGSGRVTRTTHHLTNSSAGVSTVMTLDHSRRFIPRIFARFFCRRFPRERVQHAHDVLSRFHRRQLRHEGSVFLEDGGGVAHPVNGAHAVHLSREREKGSFVVPQARVDEISRASHD